jgi:uncharacterized protein (DUF924 family)
MSSDQADIAAVLDFWFTTPADPDWGTMRKAWWEKDAAFDQACRDVGMALHARALRGELDVWKEEPLGALAFVVLCDQLPRNMFRGTPQMYGSDPLALAGAKLIDARGWRKGFTPVQRLFSHMPYEHAESVPEQEEHVAFVRDEYDGPEKDDCLQSAERHLEIVARFGRFPHRNDILGRETTTEEAAFLKEPNSSF